jgi:hypothetical protein
MNGAIATDAVFTRRYDIPTGVVPEYREFVRWAWSWRDEAGRPALEAPPWMYSLIACEPAEVTIISSLLGTLHQLSPFSECFEVIVLEDGSEFSFANLAALHAFLRSCAALGASNETARRVCEYIMWTLGFRWV